MHGVFRIVLQLDGEDIVNAVPDIGYHHRGAEKMGERQSWHTYIPYTDRIDYLGGVMNNLPYVLAVEKLAGIEVPDRVKVIRVMLAELFRIISHLGVLRHHGPGRRRDVAGVLYVHRPRARLRSHRGDLRVPDASELVPHRRRFPGSAAGLGPSGSGVPRLHAGAARRVRQARHEEPHLQATHPRASAPTRLDEAIDWGVTGPGLRACGFEWDYRKQRPYSGYEQFEFDIPTGTHGDCYDRTAVRVEEMRQSLRIVRQCLENMPEGSYKSRHPLTTPPLKDHTMHDIETLITHFLNVSWGPVIPPGEASVCIEATKGLNSYYLISDGGTMSYRTRIRTPSFPHLQMIPLMCRGSMVADLIAVLGSIDFVMADVDR